jgi:hypothetical protein
MPWKVNHLSNFSEEEDEQSHQTTRRLVLFFFTVQNSAILGFCKVLI